MNTTQNVTMLLYADDLVLIGDQIGRVQKLLNVLSEFCYKWGLQVNMSKTEVLVYRNGGIIKNKSCQKPTIELAGRLREKLNISP